MNEHKFWIHVKPWNVSICIPPKCGSSSFKFAMVDEFEEITRKKAFAIMAIRHPTILENSRKGHTVAVVRNPIDRFRSLYKDKVLSRRRFSYLEGMSQDELLDYIGTHENHHWYPQHRFIGGSVCELLPLEKFTDWWNSRAYTKKPLTLKNVTHSQDQHISEEVVARLKEMYAEDFALYERACRGY